MGKSAPKQCPNPLAPSDAVESRTFGPKRHDTGRATFDASVMVGLLALLLIYLIWEWWPL